MMVRVDNDLAKVIRQNASAYRKAFKRRKSFATIANQAMRSAFYPRPTPTTFPATDGLKSMVKSAVKTFNLG